MNLEALLAADSFIGVAIGLGLAAAAGFRIFVPLLIASIAAKTGVLTLAPGFDWLTATPMMAALATATVLEVGAYSVPWLDQLLDLIATPAALLAGMLAVASVVVELPPYLRWAVILMGAGAAGVTQGASVLTRFKSTTATAGAGNPVVAMAELIGAVLTSILAIFLPVITLVMLLVLVLMVVRRLAKRRRSAPQIRRG